MTEKPKSRRGSVKKGDPARNPSGKNGFTSGWQPFHKRAEHLLAKYTLTEIRALAANELRLVMEESSWDGIVLKRLAAMIDGRGDERDEVRFLVERAEGKAIERKDVRIIKSFADLKEEELEALAAADNSD